MISINEFARRICVANHTINTPSRTVPCPEHVQNARQSWGLIHQSGAKTLRAILAIATEEGVSMEEPVAPLDQYTVACLAHAGKTNPDDLTAEDWDAFMKGATAVPASSRFPASIPHG